MFLLIPWRVDVPQDRWPVMNWLILLALPTVFALQVRDYIVYKSQPAPQAPTVQPGVSPHAPAQSPTESRREAPSEAPGITHDLLLRGWGLKGLLGYMWLHGGLLHLFGNLLFLWVFGNAVCAKVGNLRYILLYVLLGVVAGMAHLLTSRRRAGGQRRHQRHRRDVSGALLRERGHMPVRLLAHPVPYVRVFAVEQHLDDRSVAAAGISSVRCCREAPMWPISLISAASGPDSRVAIVMCKKGWITMEKYEKSLLQMWEERRGGPKKESLDAAYAQLGLQMTQQERRQEASRPVASSEPEVAPCTRHRTRPPAHSPGNRGIHPHRLCVRRRDPRDAISTPAGRSAARAAGRESWSRIGPTSSAPPHRWPLSHPSRRRSPKMTASTSSAPAARR